MAASDFQVTGKNAKALFTLELHRGDAMCLVALNWKKGRPPDDFVGFTPPSGTHGQTRSRREPRVCFRGPASSSRAGSVQRVELGAVWLGATPGGPSWRRWARAAPSPRSA
jgi:hypothetical protein